MNALRASMRHFSSSVVRRSGGHGPSVAMKDVDPNWDPRGSGSGQNDGWERHDPADHGRWRNWGEKFAQGRR